MDQRQIIMMGLVALAVGGVGYAFVMPYMDGEFRAEKRQKLFSEPGAKTAVKKKDPRASKVADALKDIERREKGESKLTLPDRIRQAGLDWSVRQFYIISVLIGVVLGVVGHLAAGPLYGAAGLVVGAAGVPAWLLGFLKKRRLKRFLNEFPNAVDIIVRGVKSGLPLGDCIRIIANEAAEPVRGEFRAVIEQQTMGLTLPEAIGTLPRRVPLQEANFFAIVVEIQSKSGGNLSEILANLSKVLRDRKKMAGKVQAMSMEAKSSAGIIAALPFVVATLVYLTSPTYITVLFTSETGKMVLMGCGFMMAFGVAVMKKMINFDI